MPTLNWIGEDAEAMSATARGKMPHYPVDGELVAGLPGALQPVMQALEDSNP